MRTDRRVVGAVPGHARLVGQLRCGAAGRGARDDEGMSLEDVKEESLGLAIAAAAEARAVFAELVLPTWGTDRHGWPRTLYGQVMGGFSLLDRFSQLAVADDRQTPRMVEFAVRWLKYDPMLSNIAVQMWRHGLMHTGQPQRLIDSRAGNTWRWPPLGVLPSAARATHDMVHERPRREHPELCVAALPRRPPRERRSLV